MTLEQRIAELCSGPTERTPENLQLLAEFRLALTRGEIRLAEPDGELWKTNIWVKQGLLVLRALGDLRDVSLGGKGRHFEFDTFPARVFTAHDRVRIPPGGSCIRDGAYLGECVTCNPPVFVDVGAYIGSHTFVDSHVTIGLGTQIGSRVQISCGTQIGAALAPPPERLPTIVCDDVLIGGNCGIYGGVYIAESAVIGAGTIITAESRIFDPIKQRLLKAQPGQPLVIPPHAVIMPGSWPITKGFAARSGVTLHLPVVVAYRNEIKPGQDILEDLTH